jgi:hypothetical protein
MKKCKCGLEMVLHESQRQGDEIHEYYVCANYLKSIEYNFCDDEYEMVKKGAKKDGE